MDHKSMDSEDPLELAFKEGDGLALFIQIDLCAWSEEPVPMWARHGLREGITKYMDGTVRELGEAFNIQRPKGWQRNSDELANRRTWTELMHRVNDLRRIGEAADSALFEKVGREFCMSTSKASAIYYKMLKEYLDYYLSFDIHDGLFPDPVSRDEFFTAIHQRANFHLCRDDGQKLIVTRSYIEKNLHDLYEFHQSHLEKSEPL